MTLLNLTSNAYPVSVYAVRQANPNVSFPGNPTDEDLAPFGYVNVTPLPQPSHDPRTQRIEEATPKPDADGIYHQLWLVRAATAEEIAAYDAANPPTPDWARFKAVAMNSDSLNAILATAYQSVPVAAGALAPALMRCEAGDVVDFATAWSVCCTAANVPSKVIAGFVGVATACHLPEEFVAALGPLPE
jgi:hypothetical protein